MTPDAVRVVAPHADDCEGVLTWSLDRPVLHCDRTGRPNNGGWRYYEMRCVRRYAGCPGAVRISVSELLRHTRELAGF